MNLPQIYVALSIILSVISYTYYLRTIYKGTTKPHAFTWFIWAFLTGVAFFAQREAGAGIGAWATGFTTLMCTSVFILAFFQGEKDITRSDWITFIAALCTIPVWLATNTPLYAVILVTLIDVLGFYPTFRKSWNKPFEESTFLYTASALIFFLGILAIETVNITTVLYSATVVFMNSLFVLMLLWRRRRASL